MVLREIIDESDVFVDVHKAIRRMAPAPKSRIPKGEIVTEPDSSIGVGQENAIDIPTDQPAPHLGARASANGEVQPDVKRKSLSAIPETGTSPKATFLLRRTSSITGASDRENLAKRGDTPEMREHFKHLGPSNLASRPRQTRYNTVKIKPGGGTLTEAVAKARTESDAHTTQSLSTAPQGGVGEGLLQSAGKDAKDGVHAVQTGYGTIGTPPRTPKSPEMSSKAVQVEQGSDAPGRQSPDAGKGPQPSRTDSTQSQSTIGSLHSQNRASSLPPEPRRDVARSGSITQNIVDAGGIKKVVLEMTSGSDENGEGSNGAREDHKENNKPEQDKEGKSGKTKRRRKRRKGGQNGEDAPLLERDEE